MSLAQLRHREFRQAGQFRTRFADREHRPDRVGSQPPRCESQRLPGRLTQPLPVIDHVHQRLLSESRGLPLGELGGIAYEAIEARYVLADLAEL